MLSSGRLPRLTPDILPTIVLPSPPENGVVIRSCQIRAPSIRRPGSGSRPKRELRPAPLGGAPRREDGSNCPVIDWVLLRVTGDPDGRVLVYDRNEWLCFLDGAARGEFDWRQELTRAGRST